MTDPNVNAHEILERIKNRRPPEHVYFLEITQEQYQYAEEKMARLHEEAHRTLAHLIPFDTDPRATDFTSIFSWQVAEIWLTDDLNDWFRERNYRATDRTLPQRGYPHTACGIVRVCEDGVHEEELVKVTIADLTLATEFKLTFSERIRQEQHPKEEQLDV